MGWEMRSLLGILQRLLNPLKVPRLRSPALRPTPVWKNCQELNVEHLSQRWDKPYRIWLISSRVFLSEGFILVATSYTLFLVGVLLIMYVRACLQGHWLTKIFLKRQ